jgi:transposase
MPGPISTDLRKRVTEAHLRGEGSYADLSERFAIGAASVSRWLRLVREEGSVEPKPASGGSSCLIPDERLGEFKELVRDHADATLEELVELVAEEMRIKVTTSTLGRTFKRARITRKKSRSTPKSRTRRRSSN